jgi:Anti-sigma-K factor rskA
MTDHLSDDERAALLIGELSDDIGREEAADVARLTGALARASTWAEPRAVLEDLVVQAVVGSERTEVASVTALRRPVVAQHRVRRRPRRRLGVLASAAAVIAASAIAGGVLLGHHDERSDFRGVLTASPVAPGARGAADMYKTDAGFRVELDARGLPRLRVDEYYQAWLTNANGTSVPIGTFSANGGDVTLWSGVSPVDFPKFSITIELADNDQRSSGRAVLAGEIRARLVLDR